MFRKGKLSGIRNQIWDVAKLQCLKKLSSQDSSVGSMLDWYLEGSGFKSRRLQINFQLEKGCGRDYMQYSIKYGWAELNLEL